VRRVSHQCFGSWSSAPKLTCDFPLTVSSLGGHLFRHRLAHHPHDGSCFPVSRLRSFSPRRRRIQSSLSCPSRLSRLDRSRAKWRIKLQAAFNSQATEDPNAPKKSILGRFRKSKTSDVQLVDEKNVELAKKDKREGRSAKWVLFMLPFITVLREGLEAVVFVAGVRQFLSSVFAAAATVR
jgi:hypothetical protein